MLKNWRLARNPSKKLPKRPSKRLEEREKKAEENNKHIEKKVSRSLEVISKIPEKERILKVLSVSTVIREVIIPINVQKSQKTSYSLDNLYVNNCKYEG